MEGRHNRIDLTFSRNLNQIMIDRQIYPSQLSRMSGVSRANIHKYLCGTSQPSAYNIKRIAQALDVTSDFLLGIEK